MREDNITFYLISITVVATVLCWFNPKLQALFMGCPYKSYHANQWYRLLTDGFIHGSLPHLGFNMYVLYSFGALVENRYAYAFGTKGGALYLLLYIGGVVSAGLADVWSHANNPYYQTLGASSGVSAVVFSSILLNPHGKILLNFFIPIPGWLFGIGYLLVSYSMIGGSGGVNHLAHLVGSLYGVIFTFIVNQF